MRRDSRKDARDLSRMAQSNFNNGQPISLDLHTYSHQEAFSHENDGHKWHSRPSMTRRRHYYDNKENKYAIRRSDNNFNRLRSDARRRTHLLSTKMAFPSPSSSSNGGSVDFRHLLSRSRPFALEIEDAYAAYELDGSAASSSLSADELLSPYCNGTISKENGKHKPFDKHKYVEDDDRDAERYDENYSENSLRHGSQLCYSTSDLTTSDSEIFRHPIRGENFRKNNLLTTKFPSLSTIYPANSSISLDDVKSLESTCYKKGANRKHPSSHRWNAANELKNDLSKCTNDIKSANHVPLLINVTPQCSDDKSFFEMAEEISPVLPPPDVNDDVDLPPVIQPLKLTKEWRPLQTSTMTDIQRHKTLRDGKSSPISQQALSANVRCFLPPPKTNPRHTSAVTSSALVHNHHRHQHTHSHYQRLHPVITNGNFTESTNPQYIKKQSVMASQQNSHVSLEEAPTPPPKSLFDPYYKDLSETCPAINDIRPEQYNLPSQLARKLSIKGILYLKILITGWKLSVTIRNAAYFFKEQIPISSFVKLEVKRSKEYCKRAKYEARRDYAYVSVVVPATRRPDFYETFDFPLTRANLRSSDKLRISVHHASSINTRSIPTDYIEGELIGQMSFSIRKLFRKANMDDEFQRHNSTSPIKVCEGGYFLLPANTGSTSHLSQDNILHQKYYDEIGSAIYTAQSSTSSRMMNESECRAHASNFGEAPETMPIAFDTRYRIDPSQHHRKQSGTLSVGDCSPCKSAPTMTAYDIGSPSHRLPNGFQRIIPSRFQRNYSTMPDGVRQIEYDRRIYAPISSDANKDVNDMMVTLDYTTASTSTSSGASSGIEYKRRHRCTLPSITTTITDTTTSDYSNADSLDNHQNAINYGLLHVQKLDEDDIDDETAKNNKNRTQERENRLKNEISEVLNDNNGEKQLSKTRQSTNAGRSGVRRVASFTFSSEGSKHNHRHLPTSGPLTRKFTLGPLGKTFSYLKNKMDIANSSPSLYDITNEDCHHWQESFEALLNNKYGCALFRQFLNQEFSVENLDFWLNCKEFKRMKSGKKATAQKAQHIFNLYVKDGAEKEVNLDSATKAATKAAMESGIHANTFDLAQTKIEQLMAKDSYPRFLKSDLYLAALNGDQPQHFGAASIKRTESARDVTPMTGTTARRHTCVPDQSESLAVHEIVDRLRSGQLAAKVTSGTTNPTSASADGLKSV